MGLSLHISHAIWTLLQLFATPYFCKETKDLERQNNFALVKLFLQKKKKKEKACFLLTHLYHLLQRHLQIKLV